MHARLKKKFIELWIRCKKPSKKPQISQKMDSKFYTISSEKR